MTFPGYFKCVFKNLLTSVKVCGVLFYSMQLTMLRFITAENNIEQVKKWQATWSNIEESYGGTLEHFL